MTHSPRLSPPWWQDALMLVVLLLVFAMGLYLMLSAGGCDSAAKTTAKGGSKTLQYDHSTAVQVGPGATTAAVMPDGTQVPPGGSAHTNTRKKVASVAPTYQATGKASEGEFNANPDNVSLDGMSAGGGGGGALFKATGDGAINAFTVIGIICLLAGGVLFYFKQTMGALVSVGCGIGLIAIGVVSAEYPWVWLAVVVVALGGLGYFVYLSIDRARDKVTVRTVVAAIEHQDERTKAAVTDEIKSVASRTNNGKTVRAVVEAAKVDAVN